MNTTSGVARTIMRVIGILVTTLAFATTNAPGAESTFRIRLGESHPWRPPFGLERVGAPRVALVETDTRPSGQVYSLVARRAGREIERQDVKFPAEAPFLARVSVDGSTDELILSTAPDAVPLVTQAIQPPALEAEAIAKPDTVINPVDLGTILVPAGWLLLGPDQSATLDLAAISLAKDLPTARVRAWFESTPSQAAATPFPLSKATKAKIHLGLPRASAGSDRDTLRVSLEDGDGGSLWQKSIPVMRVHQPATWPKFGATATKLRFDPPISVRDPKTGTFSSIPFESGFSPKLHDIVISFPSGARYVFWRGSSYIPFWAGKHNTAACYEWAEIASRLEGVVDCVEPLMDKELRYGRVEIVESTPARVHVRWTYQSNDLNYKVWGDRAVEDYYFTPDGFGTRVVHLRADPKTEYELNEFIVITPQDAYPLDVLPKNLVDGLFLDGRKHEYQFPHVLGSEPKANDVAAIYRLRLSRHDEPSAVCFNPNLTAISPAIFGPFYDNGLMVTPCYWGSHWPVARGNATGSKIDDRIHVTPTHNSVMSWATARPKPLRSAEMVTLDTLGQSKPMTERTWVWLIGMTDEADGRLVDRAKSFATPPSLEVKGASLDTEAYVPERRAFRLRVEASEMTITLKPATPCVNPTFELIDAPVGPITVALHGKPLDADRFAWDGKVLWLEETIPSASELQIHFAGQPEGGRR